MGIKSVYLISIIHFLFLFNLYLAASINNNSSNKNSILNVIIGIEHSDCVGKSTVINSKYVQDICSKETFPEKVNITVSGDSTNKYLCIALVERGLKNCNIKNLADQKLLNDGVDKILTNSSETLVVEGCKEWQSIITDNEKTKPFIDKLNSLIAHWSKCIPMCVDPSTDKLNPLCASIFYIDQYIKANAGNNNTNSNKNNNVNDVETQKKLEKKTDADKNIPVASPKDSEKETKITDTKKTNDAIPVKTPPVENTQSKPDSSATEVEHKKQQTSVKDDDKTKNTALSSSGGSTANNDDAKLSNQDDKTTVRVDDDSTGAKPPILSKKEEDTIDGDEKTIPIDQTQMNGDEGILPHPGDGDIPLDDDGPMMGDDTDKIDEDVLAKESSKNDDEQKDSLSSISNMQKDDDPHFFGYFTILGLVGIIGCLAYHHKQKILAILLEGRRSRGGRGRRRPSTASYRKLDCTLEEAVTSQCNANVTHVIY